MTTDQQIAVLTRMRELLADPDRVVLDPLHYFEVENGMREVGWEEARVEHDTCRVCFCAAATMATFEIAEDEYYSYNCQWARDTLTDKALALGIEADPDVKLEFGDSGDVVTLTSALKAGRAVEVVDACLADLSAVAA